MQHDVFNLSELTSVFTLNCPLKESGDFNKMIQRPAEWSEKMRTERSERVIWEIILMRQVTKGLIGLSMTSIFRLSLMKILFRLLT